MWSPVVGLLAGGLAAGCTFSRTDVVDCRSNVECRREFGVGFVCNADSLCEAAAPTARCTRTYPEDLFENRADHKDRIIFGNLMDRSVMAQEGRELAAQLAYEQANQEQGLNGRPFGAVFCNIAQDPMLDDLARGAAAVESAGFLADVVGVPAILGPSASTDTEAVFSALENRAVLLISPSATGPSLTNLDEPVVTDDLPGLLWRTCPSDRFQGQVIARDMLDNGEGRKESVNQVDVIYEVGAYGEGLFEVFREAFTTGDPPRGEVVGHSFGRSGDGGQLSDAIADVAGTGRPEVLFISSQSTDVIDFMDAAAAIPDYDERGIFLTDAAANGDVMDNANPARLDQVRGTRPAPVAEGDPVSTAFIAAYTAKYGAGVESLSYASNAYDAAWLLMYGAAWAVINNNGQITGLSMARGLRRVSQGEAIQVRPSDWERVLMLFGAGQGIDISGASGPLNFDPTTEETLTDIEVWRVVDGVPTRIYTVSP